MKLFDLLQPWVSAPLPDVDILGLQNDSRKVSLGDVFFAYPGAVVDGRLFMSDAVLLGAAAVVYDPGESMPSILPTSVPVVPIRHLFSVLALIAARFYNHPSRLLAITGVTGTNGKTSIAWQLAGAYDSLGLKAAYVGTLGEGRREALRPLLNTTPDGLCLQRLLHEYQQNGLQRVCMEVSSHALHEHRTDGIDFSEAIFTNLSLDHLDYHHTMDAYAKAKAMLFAMPSLTSAVINHDDAYAATMAAALPNACQAVMYGLQEGADVRAVSWCTHMRGSDMDITSPWGRYEISVPLIGQFNVYNSLAVFSSLMTKGFATSDVLQVMSQLQASPGRMEIVSQTPLVIVDFAHTPDALENVLSTLTQLKQGRLGVVFGCGGDRDKSKRPLMGRIASQYADFVIITSDNPRSEDPDVIINEITAGLLPQTKMFTIVDRKEAIYHALHRLESTDVLLIAGKGHEAYQQIGHTRLPFSDQAVVKEWLIKNGIVV